MNILHSLVKGEVEGLRGVEGLLILADLHTKCKNPHAAIDPSSEALLKKWGLLDDQGRPDNVTRAIVLSAIEGDGANIRLTNNPIQR